MTYVPPERDDDAPDQTQKLDVSPTPLPAVGNGVDGGGPPSPFQPAPTPPGEPVDPFASPGGEILDGPADPGPSRDRLAPQFVWEAILLVLAAAALFLVYQRRGSIFGVDLGDGLSTGTPQAEALALAPILLAVIAFGLSLRIGAPNLAVLTVPFVIPVLDPLLLGGGLALAAAWTAGYVLAATLLYALLTFGFRVNPWFAGVITAVGVSAATEPLLRLAERLGYEAPVEPWTVPNGYIALGAVAVLAVGGGLLGLVPGLRDQFSAAKAAAGEDEADRPAGPVWLSIGGTFLALGLAALAGVARAGFDLAELGSVLERSVGGGVGGYPFIVFAVFCYAAVLLGGTSPGGRRGGVLGAVLATVLMAALTLLWYTMDDPAAEGFSDASGLWNDWTGLLYFGLVLVGVLVAFVLDRLGRPKESADEFAPAPIEQQPFGPTDGGLFAPGTRPEQETV